MSLYNSEHPDRDERIRAIGEETERNQKILALLLKHLQLQIELTGPYKLTPNNLSGKPCSFPDKTKPTKHKRK